MKLGPFKYGVGHRLQGPDHFIHFSLFSILSDLKQMPERNKKRDSNAALRTEELIKTIMLISDEHSSAAPILEDLYFKGGTIASSSSFDALPTSAQVNDLFTSVKNLHSYYQKQLEILNDFKSKIIVWFDVKAERENRAAPPKGDVKKGEQRYDPTQADTVRSSQLETKEKNEELKEINEFYATLVAQHDMDDKAREKSASACEVPLLNTSTNQRVLVQEEKISTLLAEKEALEMRLKQQEYHLLAATRRYKAYIAGNTLPQNTLSEHDSKPTERIKARIILPEPWTGQRCESFPSTKGEPFPVSSNSINPVFTELRGFPPIHISNPSPQEKTLLQRISLYESKLEELEMHEINRKRCCDEKEKTQAEIFTSMNEELDKRKRTIHSLSIERDHYQQSSSNSLSMARLQYEKEAVNENSLVSEDKSNLNLGSEVKLLIPFLCDEFECRTRIQSYAVASFVDLILQFNKFFIFQSMNGKAERPSQDRDAEEVIGLPQLDCQRNALMKQVYDEKRLEAMDAVFSIYGDYIKTVRQSLLTKVEDPPGLTSSIDDELSLVVTSIRHLKEISL